MRVLPIPKLVFQGQRSALVLCLFSVAVGCAGSPVRSPGGSRGGPTDTPVAMGSGGATGMGGGSMTPGSGSTVSVGSGGATTPMNPPAVFACDPAAMPVAPPNRLWRLTPEQYGNSVAALFTGRRSGTEALPAAPAGLVVPLEASTARYSTEAARRSVTDVEFRRAVQSSATTAADLVKSLKASGCWATDSTGANQRTCVESIVADKGAMLFRRPLAADEVTHYSDIVTLDKDTRGPDGALALAFQTLLMAPQFIFQPEIGMDVKPGVRQLTPFETASSVAYALTSAPPDADLWNAASRGELGTFEQMKAQVSRILAGPAAVGARNFAVEYFQLQRLLTVPKVAEGSPLAGAGCNYTRAAAVAQGVQQANDLFASNLTNGFLKSLLTNETEFYSCGTAGLFGLNGGPDDSAPPMKSAALTGQRAGLLTHPALMGALATRDNTMPVRRGKFINVDILCRDVPPVPIEGVPPLPDTADLTMREKLAAHAMPNVTCAGCHSILDDAGLAFEFYDTVGGYRTTMPSGKAIDGNGSLSGVDDASGSFQNGVELAQLLGNSERVKQCMMRNSFRYFLGRTEDSFDSCSLANAEKAYASSGSYADFVASLLSSESLSLRSH